MPEVSTKQEEIIYDVLRKLLFKGKRQEQKKK